MLDAWCEPSTFRIQSERQPHTWVPKLLWYMLDKPLNGQPCGQLQHPALLQLPTLYSNPHGCGVRKKMFGAGFEPSTYTYKANASPIHGFENCHGICWTGPVMNSRKYYYDTLRHFSSRQFIPMDVAAASEKKCSVRALNPGHSANKVNASPYVGFKVVVVR
uniref:Uncharacterized protein n=1 Tax=Romanomermis culicivorax TaxID=13658 RepID=A0A915K561_ROMCU